MPKVTGLGHVGIYCADTAKMVEFYSGFLGLTVTDRGEDDRIVFFSAHPAQEHHEFALVKSADKKSNTQQISFVVETLADLREFYAQIVERGYPIDHVVNHGNALGCYFKDPEDNTVEVYWHTDKDWPQPYADPIDLSKSEAELRHLVEVL